jgi:hypothetical protein
LWSFREEIRILRRNKWTWVKIRDYLEEAHGVSVTTATVRNFFVRSRHRGGYWSEIIPGLWTEMKIVI